MPSPSSDLLLEPTDTYRHLLDVKELSVEFATRQGSVRAVDRASFSVRRGEIVALVGESGCGKSVSVLAILGLLPQQTGRVVGGEVLFDGVDLLKLSDDAMRERRGRDIGMVFQEPMTSLNPVLTIGLQVMEPLIAHLGMTPDGGPGTREGAARAGGNSRSGASAPAIPA